MHNDPSFESSPGIEAASAPRPDQATPEPDPAIAPSGAEGRPQESILFVDDEPLVLEGIRRNLRAKYHIQVAHSGQEALAILNQHGPSSLIVADMEMPAMDGANLLRICRDRYPDTVRIMLTGNVDLGTAVRAVNEGSIHQFLTKPCPSATLMQALENGLRQYRLSLAQREVMELRLRHAEKMSMVGQMAAAIAHDFNNILLAVGGFAELAVLASPANAQSQGFLSQLQQAVQSGRQLTRQLVGFCRKEEQIKFTELDVGRTVSQLLPLLRPLVGRAISLEADCPTGTTPVLGDAGLLDQAVLNLVLNARDASAGKGTIQVRVAPLTLEPCEGQTSDAPPGGRFACVSVSDSGCGMSEETRRRIFEPFFTTKAAGQGTGLGLAIVQSAVQQHQGRIEVESSPGQGSTFRILIPLRSPATASHLTA